MSDTPMSDIWDEYSFSLTSSIETGDLNDQSIAEIYVWPRDLELTKTEREDIKRFVHERLSEIIEKHPNMQIDYAIIASYIFRSLMCGMMFSMQKHLP